MGGSPSKPDAAPTTDGRNTAKQTPVLASEETAVATPKAEQPAKPAPSAPTSEPPKVAPAPAAAPPPAAAPAAAPANPEPEIDWAELERNQDVAEIVTALGRCKEHPKQALAGCLALQNLSNAGLNRQKILDTQGHAAVFEFVKLYKSDPKLLDAAMTLLTVMCALGKVRQHFLQDNPAPATVAEVIKLNKDNADIQIAAYRFLEKMLIKNVKHQKLRRLGIIESALEALRTHIANSGVVVAAYAVLWTLAESNKKRDTIATDEGVKAIVAAMLRHKQTGNLQLQACRLLKKVAHGSVDAEGQTINVLNIINNGAFEAVADAIQNNMNNDKLLKKALKVYIRVSSKDEIARTKMGEAKGFENVVKLLGQYKGDVTLLSRTLELLAMGVKNNADCGKRMCETGAVVAAFEILRIHKKNEQIVWRACGFLADVCEAYDAACTEVVHMNKDKAIAELLAIADSYSDRKESDGLTQAMRLLEELAGSDAGLPVLQLERPQMQLLLTALAYNRSAVGRREDIELANRLANLLELEGFKVDA